MRMQDELGEIYQDASFAELFPSNSSERQA